jgi:hypothetical protein
MIKPQKLYKTYQRIVSVLLGIHALRPSAGINVPILLVFESVFRVASMGTYNEYAPMDAP